MSSADPVSIIVPLSGGPTQALRCLEGIAAQGDEKAFEVIVIDDGAVGLESLLARLEGDVEVIRSDRRRGLAASLRLGIEHANGEVVVLIRDAAAPAAGWLSPLVDTLGDATVGMVASVTAGEVSSVPLGAFSIALRHTDLRSIDIPDVPPTLLVGTLALSLAERGLRVSSAPASVIHAPGRRTGGARRSPGEPPELTIVIPTLDAASDRVRGTLAALQAATDVAHEVVIVDNGSPPQGFASPVNAGLRAARTPYVVVMNDDVELLPGWWPPLREALDAGAAVAFPLTVDGAMRHDFAAWCFAMPSTTLSVHGHAPGEFFDPTLVVWYQDTDLLHRLRLAGCPPVLVEASRIRHGLSETVATEDAELARWIRTQVTADRERFLRKHPQARLNGATLAP